MLHVQYQFSFDFDKHFIDVKWQGIPYIDISVHIFLQRYVLKLHLLEFIGWPMITAIHMMRN